MIEGVFLHIPGEPQPPIGARLAMAALAGALATLAMALFMRFRPNGSVPPYVVGAALSRRSPTDVSGSIAGVAILSIGVLAAIAFEGLLIGYERIREPVGITVEVVIANLVTLSETLALLIVVGALYAVFSRVVFPRYSGEFSPSKAKSIRRTWGQSVVVYGIFLLTSVIFVFQFASSWW